MPNGVAPGAYYESLEDLVDEVNADNRVKWVLHAGDIRGGGSICSDEMFVDRLRRYNQFNWPDVRAPGDKEWTDCHRVSAGQYQPLARQGGGHQVKAYGPEAARRLQAMQ